MASIIPRKVDVTAGVREAQWGEGARRRSGDRGSGRSGDWGSGRAEGQRSRGAEEMGPFERSPDLPIAPSPDPPAAASIQVAHKSYQRLNVARERSIPLERRHDFAHSIVDRPEFRRGP